MESPQAEWVLRGHTRVHPSPPPPTHSSTSLDFWLGGGGIEPHPGPVQDPFSVCSSRVHAGWVALRCDQQCHSHCTGIRSVADYRLLVPGSCPAHLHCPPESSDFERTRSALIRGIHQTSVPCPDEHNLSRTCLWGRQLPATASNTSMLNCKTSFTVTRCWSPVLKTLPSKSSHSVPPSGTIARPEAMVNLSLFPTNQSPTGCLMVTYSLTTTRRKFVDLGEWALTFVNVYIPPQSSCPRNYASDFPRNYFLRFSPGTIFSDFPRN